MTRNFGTKKGLEDTPTEFLSKGKLEKKKINKYKILHNKATITLISLHKPPFIWSC